MPARPRRSLLLAAAVVVAAGLLVATRATGPVADPTGDALYAALVYVLVLLVGPRVAPWRAGAVATAVCVAVELAQLTGAPAALVQAVPVSRFVVGTTFVPVDLLAYGLGAALATVVDASVLRMVRRSREGSPTR
ncbi:DUF2809 domain-containing protein [Cellulomonas algicola]|uniref:DUF2809 domain-containing protein n=1 Tax=Cellulomonas algicola TaxID=2071633 RepID=A0A401UX78_9CELL|nr:DUF2809 domain-containing protein [Cellulomonas algicola]GCD19232.1 hypothetical protein CTKZ_07940 [Cellulomonas algicola]